MVHCSLFSGFDHRGFNCARLAGHVGRTAVPASAARGSRLSCQGRYPSGVGCRRFCLDSRVHKCGRIRQNQPLLVACRLARTRIGDRSNLESLGAPQIADRVSPGRFGPLPTHGRSSVARVAKARFLPITLHSAVWCKTGPCTLALGWSRSNAAGTCFQSQ